MQKIPVLFGVAKNTVKDVPHETDDEDDGQVEDEGHPVVPDGLGDAVLLLPSHIGTTSGNAAVQGLNEPVK